MDEPARPRDGGHRAGTGSDPYRTLFEQSADAILIIDGDAFVDCNQAAVDMLRYGSKRALLRTHPSELSPSTQPDGRDSFTKANEMIAIAFDRGSHRFEWDHKRADGEVFPVEVLLTAVPEAERTILHVVWRDISERKQLEQQLRETQKMEAIGRLAGGIAHDFNNLLVVIQGSAELLEDRLRDQAELESLACAISEAAVRAAGLTRQLLTFSRNQVVRPQTLDLGAVLLDLEKLLRRLIGEDLRLVTTPRDRPLEVRADRGQLEQVVINLTANARDAMPAGGTISIATREVVFEAETAVASRCLPAGRYAELSVRDTGVGMRAAVVKRAFEPFFTTKGVGQGTGLGLASAHGIVHEASGGIDLESAPGRGTTVRVFLPVVESPVEMTVAPPPSSAGPPGRAETILVVEDDPAVSLLVRRVLVGNGYRVVEATDGRQALQVLERGDPRVDLVFSDTVMPNMGGPELVARLRELDDAPRVLLTSGYLDSSRTRLSELAGETDFLEKPYTPTELLVRVREVLER